MFVVATHDEEDGHLEDEEEPFEELNPQAQLLELELPHLHFGILCK
jgi:hypothetical protein